MEDKNVEMIGKLLDVCKKLKETIESQASVIFKLHAQMQSQDDRIKSLELTLEDNPDKEVILSFEYDILDPFGFDREDFGKQEFGDLLGDILVDVIDKYGTGEQFESDD